MMVWVPGNGLNSYEIRTELFSGNGEPKCSFGVSNSSDDSIVRERTNFITQTLFQIVSCKTFEITNIMPDNHSPF